MASDDSSLTRRKTLAAAAATGLGGTLITALTNGRRLSASSGSPENSHTPSSEQTTNASTEGTTDASTEGTTSEPRTLRITTTSTINYELVVRGAVTARPGTETYDAEPLANDLITAVDPGLWRVRGHTGDGEGDQYVIDGEIVSMEADIPPDRFSVEVDGETVDPVEKGWLRPRDNTLENPTVKFSFDREASLDKFTSIGDESRHEIVTRPAFSGRGCLRSKWSEGDHYGAQMSYSFLTERPYPPMAAHARFFLRIPRDFQIEQDGKASGEMGKLAGFHGKFGSSAGNGGRPTDGTNGWSARMTLESAGADAVRPEWYVYHADMKGPYGDTWEWPVTIQKGRWAMIDLFCRRNTAGENDGVVRSWIDGARAFDKRDIRFTDQRWRKIESFVLSTYWGGKWTSPTWNELFFDELSLYRSAVL